MTQIQIELENIEKLQTHNKKPVLIAGPCSAESREQVLDCATQLSAQGIGIFRAGVWKPRTRPSCFGGVGEPALKWLKEVKEKTGMAVTTEVAHARHVEAALEAGIDILWIGARTTTSPFAVQEIADSLRNIDIPVLVKNPINAELDLWLGAFERLAGAGVKRLAAIHRGFSSYGERIYRYAPHWQIPVELRRRIPGLPVLCDPSHIAGRSDLVGLVAQMALDMKSDGLFIEVHPNPEKALSDKAQQLTPAEFKQLTESLVCHRDPDDEDLAVLQPYREQIEAIDLKLTATLAERLEAARRTGDLKRLRNLTVLQPGHYRSLIDKMIAEGRKYGLDEEFVRSIFEIIHAESIHNQLEAYNKKREPEA